MLISPVYQIKVLVVVPATWLVAESKGGPFTRSGGEVAFPSKNSLEAATEEAAVSAVAASVPSAPVRAASIQVDRGFRKTRVRAIVECAGGGWRFNMAIRRTWCGGSILIEAGGQDSGGRGRCHAAI